MTLDLSKGVKFAVSWLHKRAEEMNDPHAKAILNSAAFSLGQQNASGRVELEATAPSGQAPLEGVKALASWLDSFATALDDAGNSDDAAQLRIVRSALLPVSAEPVAWMNADHVKDYRDKTADGIAWASPQQTVFYSVPLYASPPASGAVEAGWQQKCATEGCSNVAGVYFERGGVGSHYCAECYLRIQAIPAAPTEGR